VRRRNFIAALGIASGWSLTARAQQSAMPVIGFLGSTSPDAAFLAGLRDGLAEQGYVEGQNVTIEYRYAGGRYDALPALARDLVSRSVNLIVAAPSSPAALAAKSVTHNIPIVFFLGVDVVELGLVASYNRPGGNATGVSVISTSLTPKRLQLLDGLVMKLEPLALLVNPTNKLADAEIKLAEGAASALARDLIVVGASTEGEIDTAFETLAQRRAGGLAVWQEAYLADKYRRIVGRAKYHRLPTIGPGREWAEAGALMSYGANRSQLLRQIGVYAGKILRGASPADLPVVQPTTYELIINLAAAEALGLTIPLSLLASADEVIGS
jgi:putative ABC transport system substrate-binding protein